MSILSIAKSSANRSCSSIFIHFPSSYVESPEAIHPSPYSATSTTSAAAKRQHSAAELKDLGWPARRRAPTPAMWSKKHMLMGIWPGIRGIIRTHTHRYIYIYTYISKGKNGTWSQIFDICLSVTVIQPICQLKNMWYWVIYWILRGSPKDS